MLLDNKGRLFGKISIIDLLIVLIILGGAFGLYYKFMASNTVAQGAGKEKVEITFVWDETLTTIAKGLSAGDSVTDASGKDVIGTIKDIKIGKSAVNTQTADGRWVLSEKPGFSSVVVTVEGEGNFTSSGISFNTKNNYVEGKGDELRAGISAIFLRISDIKKIEG